MAEPDLFVIGAAARATAAMARRAGFRVGCFDAYGDVDLVENVAWSRVIAFGDHRPELPPAEFRAIVGATPWCYGGPMENVPEWLEEAARGTVLWGNSAACCRSVCDVFELVDFLRSIRSPIEIPETRPSTDRPKGLGGWIRKPARGSGGWDVRKARTITFDRETGDKNLGVGYWQKRIAGLPFGATVASDGIRAVVLGLCESRLGAPGRPFAYAGSVGPIRGRRVRELAPVLDALADRLTQKYGLKGLWNIDLIYEPRKKRWYSLEINPRPSASMEVLEISARVSLMAISRQIFQNDPDWYGAAEACRRSIAETMSPHMKRIVYAQRMTTIERMPGRVMNVMDESGWPAASILMFRADVPRIGTVIERGEPKWTTIKRIGEFLKRRYRKFRPDVRGFCEQNVNSDRRSLQC